MPSDCIQTDHTPQSHLKGAFCCDKSKKSTTTCAEQCFCVEELEGADVFHLQAELTEMRYKLALAELQKLGVQPEEFERCGELFAGALVCSSREEDFSALSSAASISDPACLLQSAACAP